MVDAFILVKTGAGESERVLDDVRRLANVTEAHVVAGAYDIIAEANADAVYEILDASASGIQGVDGVTDTKTYFSMDD